MYTFPPHLLYNPRVTQVRKLILRKAVGDVLDREIAAFQADDAITAAEEAATQAHEDVAAARVPAAEVAIATEIRQALATVWDYGRLRDLYPQEACLSLTAEEEALIEFYVALCLQPYQKEKWMTATAHLSAEQRRSLEWRGERIYHFSRLYPLLPSDPEWIRIVHGPTASEMAAEKAAQRAWAAQEVAYEATGLRLAPLFKGLSFSTRVDLQRFAKNKTVLEYILIGAGYSPEEYYACKQEGWRRSELEKPDGD